MQDIKRKATFTFYVNNQEYATADQVLTGARIKELTGVPPDYELFQVRGSETVPVGNEETIHMHEKLHFRAIPICTFGKNGITT